jgi:hypothetical protein
VCNQDTGGSVLCGECMHKPPAPRVPNPKSEDYVKPAGTADCQTSRKGWEAIAGHSQEAFLHRGMCPG